MPAEIASLRETRAEVRLVHLGLGAFHRAHQAWYTDRADDGAAPWGIAAFTGRSPAAAEALQRQDGVYSLIERGPIHDSASVVSSIVEAHDGSDADAWHAAMSSPRVGVLTVTITEAGYHADVSGELDEADAAIIADIAALTSGSAASTAPGRIVDGLRARRAADAGSIAIASCDNLADNGRTTRSVVRALAARIDPDLADWIDSHVSFVSTMVDRITPATTADDLDAARRLLGVEDALPVVAEPFSEWILAGAFPAGRPAWETAGARFVEHIAPYEQRKLWLLNAGHSLLAYRGLLVGHETVADAMTDAAIVASLEQLWSEARAVLPLPEAEVDETLGALRERFANPRIRHALEQVARDASHKLPPRVIAPLRARVGTGLAPGQAQCGVIAAWGACLLRFGESDAASAQIASSLAAARDDDARAGVLLDGLAPDLSGNPIVRAALAARCARLPLSTDSPDGRLRP